MTHNELIKSAKGSPELLELVMVHKPFSPCFAGDSIYCSECNCHWPCNTIHSIEDKLQ